MNSDLPKVVHEVAGRAMVWWVVDAVREAGANSIILVVGHGAEHVQDIFTNDDSDITYVTQTEQLGTGHATLCAEPAMAGCTGDVLVLAGDGPLIRASTIDQMRGHHLATHAACTLATSHVENPAGYGRVVRDSAGCFDAIVEQKNATNEQLRIDEVYPSYACFDAAALFSTLHQLEPDTVSGEYYVTTVPAMLKAAGERVELLDAVPPEDVLSINTTEQLAEVDAILSARMEAMR